GRVGSDGGLRLAELRVSMAEARRLPLRERHVLLLRHFGDLTQAETARRLGLSERHVQRLERKGETAIESARNPMSGFSTFPRVYEVEPITRRPFMQNNTLPSRQLVIQTEEDYERWALQRVAEIIRSDWPRSSYVPSRDGVVLEADFESEPLHE